MFRFAGGEASVAAQYQNAGIQSRSGTGWACIVPYYNEAHMIERCLTSLARQTALPFVVLVDNGSTDNGRTVAESFCAANGLRFISLIEASPGKVAALAAGLAATSSHFVATCDADTYYPPEYLMLAEQLLTSKKAVAAGAMLVTNPQARLQSGLEKLHWRFAAFLAPWQCHTGGAGQVFLTQALREAGGFDTAKWNFVLEDHEVIGRIGLLGRISEPDRKRSWVISA